MTLSAVKTSLEVIGQNVCTLTARPEHVLAWRSYSSVVLPFPQALQDQMHTRALQSDDNDNHNDSDHSSSQLPVRKALTCSKGQSVWAVDQSRPMHKIIDQGTPLRSVAA